MQEAIENEIKLVLSNETQAKFTPNISPEELDSFFARLKALLEFAGYSISDDKRILNLDKYFDTKNLDFEKAKHALRVRSDGSGLMYTVKKPLENGISLQRRREIEDTICSDDDLSKLINSNFSDIVNEHLSDFSGQPIFLSAIIKNDRRQFFATKGGEKYKVCLDCSIFSLPDSKIESSEDVELEIEAASDEAYEKIDGLKSSIMSIFPEFSFSHGSKYGRAAIWLDPYRTNLYHKIVKFSKDKPAVSFAILIVGFVGSIFSVVSFFI